LRSNLYITKHGIKIPFIGFGTYKVTGSDGQRAIEEAIGVGYRHIDSAQYYGNEKEVGNAVRNSGLPRDDFFITTKIWPDNFKRVSAATQESLKRLNMEYVDLMLLHWPSTESENRKAVDDLNEILLKQYVRSIGVSNFSVAQMERAKKQAPVICNQVEFNPFVPRKKELDFVHQNDMFLTAHTPLARGKVLNDKTLQAIAAKHDMSPAQVTLQWLISQGDTVVIPKAMSIKRMKENFEIFDFTLDDEDRKLIDSLGG
jgi:2,5-diketo-D-gluconate reductase B